MPNIHYDKLIEYENDNDIASIVKDYIELNVKCGNGTATQEEIEARDDYIAHLIETDENEKPKRGIHFITRLNEEILKIKADLNIQMAMEAEQLSNQILNGEYPGLERYKDDPKASYDIAGNMIYASELGLTYGVLGSILYDLNRDFVNVHLEEQDIKRLNLPENSTLSNLVENDGEKIIEGYLSEESKYSIMSVDERNHYRKEGGELNTDLSDNYGIEYKDGTLKPKVIATIQDFNPFGYHNYSDEPVIEDGEIVKNGRYVEADPDLIYGKSKEKHIDRMIKYKNSLDKMIDAASEKLTKLTELSAYKKNQSKEFDNMLEALSDLASMSAAHTPKQINNALIKLENASTAYRERIDGSYFKGIWKNGRERRDLSDELAVFSGQMRKELSELDDHHFNRDRGIDDQIKRIRESVKEKDREKVDIEQLNKEEGKTVKEEKIKKTENKNKEKNKFEL